MPRIALLSRVSGISRNDLLPVAAALQRQVSEHFGPAWNTYGEVIAVSSLDEAARNDAWPIVLAYVSRELPYQWGVHDLSGQPFAVVRPIPGFWTRILSHECLEMLCDPTGTELVAGTSPQPGQGTVQFLREICDPCQHNGYEIPTSWRPILVSDFYLPSYFDSATDPSEATSYWKSLRGPLHVPPGGCISWLYGNEWWQMYGGEDPKPLPTTGVGFTGSYRYLLYGMKPPATEGGPIGRSMRRSAEFLRSLHTSARRASSAATALVTHTRKSPTARVAYWESILRRLS